MCMHVYILKLYDRWKPRKHNQPSQRRPRAQGNNDGGGHNTHHNVPPQGPPVPTAILQPMTVLVAS